MSDADTSIHHHESCESNSSGTPSGQSFSAYRRARATSAAARDQAILVGMLATLTKKLDDVSTRPEKLEGGVQPVAAQTPSFPPGLELKDTLVEDALFAIFSMLESEPEVTGISVCAPLKSVSVGVQTEPLVQDLKLEFLEAKLEAMDMCSPTRASICTQTDTTANQPVEVANANCEAHLQVPKSISASARPSAEEELDARLEAMVAAHAERMTMIRLSPEQLFESICRDVEQAELT